MVTLIVQQYEHHSYSCKEVSDTSNGSWSFSILCFTGVSRAWKRSIQKTKYLLAGWWINHCGCHCCLYISPCWCRGSSTHRMLVPKAYLLTECRLWCIIIAHIVWITYMTCAFHTKILICSPMYGFISFISSILNMFVICVMCMCVFMCILQLVHV